ncbi:MAG: acetyl-CoA hydrolase/transferase C-terminal domain-containing protein [Pseudobdellovibrio sp.]
MIINTTNPKYCSAAEAIKNIKSGSNIFIHGAAATPHILIKALVERASELTDITIYHMHTEGNLEYIKPEYKNTFKVRSLFVGANIRAAIDFDRIDYIPCFLSEMPKLFKNGIIKIDFAFIQTSPPDKNGFVSLGTSVDIAKAAALSAKCIISEFNPQMPRTFGDGLLAVSQINYAIENDHELFTTKSVELTPDEIKIGNFVAGLIEDGSCLQAGIGSIPNAVMLALKNHKHLGINTEMWSDGILDLILSGAVDNTKKTFHQGRSVCTFMMGSKKLYDYVHDNPSVFVLEADYVNNPTFIARNSRVVSVNSAVEIDLTGQVCADSIGSKIISGVGGQIDFIRGASLSHQGKPIIAISSRTKKGQPRIVPFLKEGAGVVTSRAHIHFVATEYGVADLYAKSLGERAKALIQIAHPDDREQLSKDWHIKFRTM